MIKSRLLQTNSLVNVGDFIIIKTPYPINPNKTRVIGYFILTNDVIDYSNYINGEFSILLESSTEGENNLVWNPLIKTTDGEDINLSNTCNSQTESYYIYFKFEKVLASDQIINIKKVDLKLSDIVSSNSNLPNYNKSLFKDIDLNDSNILKWIYSALEKISGNGILPSFIRRDKDFNIFWGWICHFYALIVIYGRQFQDIFSDNNLFWNFLEQKDLYKDSRVDLYEKLNIGGGELLYTPINNYKIIGNDILYKEGYIFSGYLAIREDNKIIVEFSNIDQNDIPSDLIMGVDIAFYDNEKLYVQGYYVELSKNIYRSELLIEKGKNINYVGISYSPYFGNEENINIKISSYGKGYYALEDINKQDLLNIYPTFKDRGTKNSIDSIKALCQTSLSDAFYSNYINKENIGWFLNKNCPFISNFSNSLELDDFSIEKLTPLNTGELVEFITKNISFTTNNSIKISWSELDINSIQIFCTLYTKDGINILPYDATSIINNNDENFNIINIINIPNGIREIEIPLVVIDNIKQENLINNILNIDYALICEVNFNNTNYYLDHLCLEGIYFINNKSNFVNSLDNNNDILLNNIVIGNYFNDSNLSTYSSVKLNTLNFGNSKTELSFNLVFYNSTNTILKTLNVDEALSSDDWIKGYKKIIIKDNDNNVGILLIKLMNKIISSLSNLTFDITLSSNREYIFFSSQSYNYDYIPSNAEVDFGDAFSFYILPNDILEFGNANTSNEKYSYLDVSYRLNKLPFNLGFLNIDNYYLTYYNNNGKYSDKSLEDIISQKFVPYRGFRLFIDQNNVRIYKYKPLKFLTFLAKGSDVWNSDYGYLNVDWKGGIPNYNVRIYGYYYDISSVKHTLDYTISDLSDSKLSITPDTINKIYTDGIYNLIITDNVGNELNKMKFSISRIVTPQVSYKLYCLPGEKSEIQSDNNSNEYDDLQISIKGGTPPYRITYLNNSGDNVTLSLSNNEILDLLNIKFLREYDNIIKIEDSSNNNSILNVTIRNDEYYSWYDDGNGSCVIN